jgi:transcriptional regulator with PAS, ATPase and Fis domain
MALNQTEEIVPEHLPIEIRSQKSEIESSMLRDATGKKEFLTLDQLEKKYIKEVLKNTGGNKSKAARILGIHLTSLFRKLKSID